MGKDEWVRCEWDPRFSRRLYPSYEAYVESQASKLGKKDLTAWGARFREVLRKRLAEVAWLESDDVVLCLGARTGSEVEAFLDLGLLAVGIDLNPGEGNTLVVQGDFHDLDTQSGVVDVIFTNSLDHAYDLPKVVGEIRRVLRPVGLLIVEAALGTEEVRHVDPWDCLTWERVDDLVAFLERSGFQLVRRAEFTFPWRGEQLCLEKT